MKTSATSDDIARRIADLAGTGREFEAMVDGILRSIRRSMHVPDDIDDPAVEAEFADARERLESFRAEYRDLHAALFARLLGDEMGAVESALRTDPIQHFLRSRVQMIEPLGRFLAILAEKMRATALYGRPNHGMTHEGVAPCPTRHET